MSKSIAVDFDHVTVKYDDAIALNDVNFHIEDGDYVGIIGPNGGGKTTILKSILGLVQPSMGTVAIFGQSPQKERGVVGYVPQVAQFERYFPIDVMDVVLMGRLNKSGLLKRYSKHDKEKAVESLNYVGLADQRHRQLGKLSGGQIQRVMVARALASDPRILLLDEPTASVDFQTEQNLYDLLGALNEKMTIILVSHDVGVVSSHVKSLACLNRRLFHHGAKEILPEVMEAVYGCPVDIIAHGAVPHRVLPSHSHEEPNDV
jgi:zinc transport system ATP-binding protein